MYLALYRKYRPSTFDDVISQEHITTTLKNQITSGQIAHAYLFTGTRGTGKTSCAKIMAKAVNCLSPKNGNPCGECAACKAIEEGSTDIIEIDAASNNGVDNIRQIRDEVIYTPIDCKYKVYIIDEVHMLSPGAFNALLKTLEEPPSHVIFILATTEYYKVPATILSRCQQFLFSKIDSAQSANRLLEIAQKEEIKLEPAAAELIARLSDGAMRDALSLLDQCISVSRNIDEELVRQCSGAAESEYLFEISKAAIEQNASAALKVLDGLIVKGKDISRFIEELTTHYRNMMLEKTVGEELIKASDSELSQYRSQCKKYSLEEIMRHIDLISDSLDNINRMKQTGQARILAEQLLIRLTTPRLTDDASSLSARIGALENKLDRLTLGEFSTVKENNAFDSTDKIAQKEEKAVEDKAEPLLNKKTEPVDTNSESTKDTDKINPPDEEQQVFYTHHSEVITDHTLAAYDDIPLPPPPPEEVSYGYEDYSPLDTGAIPKEKNIDIQSHPEKESKVKTKIKAKTNSAANTETKEESNRPIHEIDFILPNNAVPLPQWQEIISGMAARIKGLLKKTQAYLYDGKIYISTTVSSESVLNDAVKAEALRQRVEDVLGGEMEIYAISTNSAPAAQSEETDKISPFLEKAKTLGINVTVK